MVKNAVKLCNDKFNVKTFLKFNIYRFNHMNKTFYLSYKTYQNV